MGFGVKSNLRLVKFHRALWRYASA